MKKFFKSMLATTLIVSAVLFLGCSKDDDGGGSKGTVKFTVTASPSFSATNNRVSAGMGSSDASGNFLALKINGEQTAASSVLHTRGGSDFDGGKTYVFETVGNYNQAMINVSAYCIDDVPFTLTYKIEQGNEIISEQTVEINKNRDPYNQSYSIN